MNFYISDLHLGHEKITKLCNRPYTSQQYIEFLLENWNKKIKPNDDVYILGDIGRGDAIKILKQLNGIKHLILGNHDLEIDSNLYKDYFVSIDYQLYIKDNDKKVFLNHYPIMDWPGIKKGSYHLYGHIHNNFTNDIINFYKNKNGINVSCEVIGYLPKTLNELIKIKNNNYER